MLAASLDAASCDAACADGVDVGEGVGVEVGEGAGVDTDAGAGVSSGAGVISATASTLIAPSCFKVPLCICDCKLAAALLGIVACRTTLPG